MEEGERYPVIYVLPVEPGNQNRFGDGLLEVKKHDLHNKHHVIFAAPTFSALPWYADHPTDLRNRQETYFLKIVVPYVEGNYPTAADPQGRLLLGFSKSGFGAWSLLLRNPNVFGKAAAWDAPLMMEQPNRFGMGEIFGTQQNFEHYRIAKLLEEKKEQLVKGKRLILLGYGSFRDHHQKAEELMKTIGIDHEFRDGPERKHDWHSGWVAEAVELLLTAKQVPRPGPE
jgi:enterochelin esterase-like enzyme